MVEEIWKTAVYKGGIYENYKVSNLGRIMSVNYRRTGKAKLMTPVDNGRGYLRVCFFKNEISKMFYIHRLVAETFIPNPDNLPQVNHIDEDKTNNCVENLEWVTAKENTNYGTRNERAGKTISKLQINGKLSKKVLQFSLTGEFIREWPSISECHRNGFYSSAVCRCCNGKLPHYKGFRWEYA